MTAFLSWFSNEMAKSLCVALLHSLWQGAVWCLLLALVLRLIPRSQPQIRYAASLGSLFCVMLGVLVTWSLLRLPEASYIPQREISSISAMDSEETSMTVVENAQTRSITTNVLPQATGSVARTFTTRLFAVWSRLMGRIAWASPCLLVTWCLGVVLNLGRCTLHRAAALNLKAGHPIDDPEVLELLRSLQRRLQIHRPVQLFASVRATGPCVLGTIKPVILVPASLACGLTPDQWTAVLAHELAHIRRGDDLVNFLQMILESLLFFNPAVWWVSRQVRIEREACCDVWGAKLTQSSVHYARVLVDVAEQLTALPRRPLLAFADERSGPLLDRVRRLVSPQDRSDLRVTTAVSIVLTVLVLGAVVLLQRGSDLAVFTAAQFLNDEQRVTELNKVAEQVSPQFSGTERNLTIHGTVRTEDGKPLPERIYVSSMTRLKNASVGATQEEIPGAKSDRFRVDVRSGVTWLYFTGENYATAIAGPFNSQHETEINDVRVVLKPGVSIPAKIVDETGQPVAGAKINWSVLVNGSGFGAAISATSNENGEALLLHIDPTSHHRITVTAPGFQKLQTKEMKLSPAQVIELQVQHARPATGIVLDSDDQPLAGATLKMLRRKSLGYNDSTGYIGPPLATTSADGKFVLGELLDGYSYDIVIQHSGFGPALLRNVQPGVQNLSVQLPPDLHVTGTVRGPEELLTQIQNHSRWRFEFDQHPPGSSALRGQLKFKQGQGEATFDIPGLAAGLLVLSLDDMRSEHQLSASNHHLTIHLDQLSHRDQPLLREVRIVFVQDGKPVQPEGAISFSTRSPDRQKQYGYEQKTLQEGCIKTSLPTPCKIVVSSGSGLIGYALQDLNFEAEILAEDGAATVEIPVRPAGAVRGVVLENDGAPAENMSVFVGWIWKADISGNRREQTTGQSVMTNAAGEFFVTPLPFGAECSLRISRDKYIQIGPEFVINEANALPDLKLEMGKSVSATIQVIDPDGNPMRGVPMSIFCRHPRAVNVWKGEANVTNGQGQFVIDAINPALARDMYVSANCRKDFVPGTGWLRADGGVITIQLERGLIIEGRLLDARGEPVVGQFLKAAPVKIRSGSERTIEYFAEAPTDARGRFRFSNLPREHMRIQLQHGAPLGEDSYLPASTNGVKPILLKSR